MSCFAVNRLSGTRPGWHIANVLASIDQYGRSIPTFTLKGQDMINTAIGGLMTVITLITVTMFATTKTIQLVNGANPTVSSVAVPEAVDVNEIVNLGETNFRFAFTLESKLKVRNDPKFLRWYVRSFGKRDGKSFEKIHPIHLCTDDDMREFYPVSPEWSSSF